ncbi:MAG: NFACT family protein, partial [Rhodothermia bacterium]|nr:NFACT family protein [Rhodothermia bacterium]
MLTTFYSYRELAHEWNSMLTGMAVNGAYSSGKNELAIEISDGSRLVFGARGSFRYLFRSERTGRPRKNVTDLLSAVHGMSIGGVGIADRDRLIRIEGAGSRAIVLVLYGSQPNVLAIRDGVVEDAFKSVSRWVGKSEPDSRAAEQATTVAEFVARTAGGSVTNRKAVSRAFPLFDKELVAEVFYRCGLDPNAVFETESAQRLYEAGSGICGQIEEDATPRIYWEADQPAAFSLIELQSRGSCREEAFDTTDGAVSVYCRSRLAALRYSERLNPLLQSVADAAARAKKRKTELEVHLERESRA